MTSVLGTHTPALPTWNKGPWGQVCTFCAPPLWDKSKHSYKLAESRGGQECRTPTPVPAFSPTCFHGPPFVNHFLWVLLSLLPRKSEQTNKSPPLGPSPLPSATPGFFAFLGGRTRCPCAATSIGQPALCFQVATESICHRELSRPALAGQPPWTAGAGPPSPSHFGPLAILSVLWLPAPFRCGLFPDSSFEPSLGSRVLTVYSCLSDNP